MLEEMRTPAMTFPEYANSPATVKQENFLWLVDSNESSTTTAPPPVPPRCPRATNVLRTQSLETGQEAPSRRHLATPGDACHRRRSLRLTCGGGVVSTTVDVSASCPPTPLGGGVCSFSADIHLDLRMEVEEKRRYRYPFHALIVDDVPSADSLSGGRPEDVDCIAATQNRLRESGFYYEGVSWQEAIDLLTNKPEGTFLVRDSQDPRFLFSLSVQTKRGPTSVRIHYVDGLFSFDAVRKMARTVPRKKCVVDLVDFYVSVCDSDRLKCHVWLDKNGDTFDHVRLRTPLKHCVAPLKHAARLAVNRAAVRRADLANVLPASLKQYLEEYPNTS